MSLSSHQKVVGDSQVWLTPKWILKPLGSFDLDPCSAPLPRPWNTANVHFDRTQGCDGLAMNWAGRVWLNPPFDQYIAPKWMERMVRHGNGIALLAARTETKMFFKYVWEEASSILFLNRRPYFHYPDGTRAKSNSGAPIALIGYGERNDRILEAAKELGKFIPLAKVDATKEGE